MVNRLICPMFIVFASLSFVSCSESHQLNATEDVDSLGVLQLPLSTTSESGASYRLVHATFSIVDAITGNTSSSLSSDTDPSRTDLTTNLETGTYTVSLAGGWQLEYLNTDGNWVAVPAMLNSPAVQSAAIVAGEQTTVDYQFRANGELINMPSGTLNVSVSVIENDTCTINGIIYVGGARNPHAFCQSCVPATSQTRWTPDTNCRMSLAVGNTHACVAANGTAYCWGDNSTGQLGDGTQTNRTTPTRVEGLASDVSAIAAGFQTCAISSDRAYCWGTNNNGQLGDGTYNDSNLPVQVQGLNANVNLLTVGVTNACAVAGNYSAYCWGSNGSGELGDGSDVLSNPLPTAASLHGGAIDSIAASSYFACAARFGNAYCWGRNDYGQLGNGTVSGPYGQSRSPTPTQVVGFNSDIASVTTGGLHACALTWYSEAYCWGSGENGALGSGSDLDSSVPVPVVGLTSSVTAITASWVHTCAVMDGAAYCWGKNLWGQLGTGVPIGAQTNVPQPVIGLGSGVTAISSFGASTCAIARNRVYCWGDNSHGQLGNGTIQSSETPVEVTP